VTDLRLARSGFDVGVLTNNAETMLPFWNHSLGLPLERTTKPVPGVTQHKLTLLDGVLKLNCYDSPMSGDGVTGYRMLLIADAAIVSQRLICDPDGNQLGFVPRGFNGVYRYGLHLAVSDELAFHDFYARILGLPAVGERAYDLGGATLTFAWSPDAVRTKARSAPGFGYITIQVIDVMESHAVVCGRGAEEQLPPSSSHTSTESTISFIRDPDGNPIEISQRPDLVASHIE
jgi:catechol 2,3-dioxygenase-like lactoylglutathione lyase family enzyme